MKEYQRMTSSRRRLFGGLTAMVLITLSMLGGNAPASADTYYTTINTRVNGMCLDNPGSSTTNFKTMQIYYCNGNVNQQWIYRPGPTGGYGMLVNAASLKCLNVYGNSTSVGGVVNQAVCTALPNQQWSVADVFNGYIRSELSGLCLSVQNYNNKQETFQATCGTYVSVWNLYS
jgi:ricin-type beta-trefoil lectin protein